MKNELFIPVYSLFAMVLVMITSCKPQKYLQEVPYKFTYNTKLIEEKLGSSIKRTESQKHEYEEDLTDFELYLKEKYSIILEVMPLEVKDYKFYEVVDEWIGKPHYNEVGNKDGISMGTFTQQLYQQAYGIELPPSPIGIFNSNKIELFTGRKFLKEGDIIFFRYNKDNPVSDIAIYLKNDLILTSTPNNGLAIFDFNLEYFQLRYLCSGRGVKEQ